MAGAEWFIAYYFSRSGWDCCIIFNPRLNGKPRVVHLYPTLMELRGGVPAAEMWEIKEIHGVNHERLWFEGKNGSEKCPVFARFFDRV